jgi:RNA polymerase sigma-70 factor (ECF subfamily)
MNPATALDPPISLDLAVSRSTPVVSVMTFEQVYEQSFDFVWRSARRLGVNEGSLDDVVQDVFVVVHRRLDDFAGRSSVRTWVFGILLRVVSDHRRSLRRRAAGIPGDPIDPDELADQRPSGPHEKAARNEASRMLQQLLDELDEEKRAVLILAELEEMAAPEIAEALGVNLNTVYSRLRAARAAFEQAVSRMKARERRMNP